MAPALARTAGTQSVSRVFLHPSLSEVGRAFSVLSDLREQVGKVFKAAHESVWGGWNAGSVLQLDPLDPLIITECLPPDDDRLRKDLTHQAFCDDVVQSPVVQLPSVRTGKTLKQLLKLLVRTTTSGKGVGVRPVLETHTFHLQLLAGLEILIQTHLRTYSAASGR